MKSSREQLSDLAASAGVDLVSAGSLEDFEKMWWCTIHVQKDGRVFLGTVVHSNPDCVALRGRESYGITGTVVNRIKKCGRCGD